MICPNCSAEFDEKTIIVCPYCGYEYMPGAKKEHRKEINQLKEKTQDMRNRSRKAEKAVKTSTSVLVKAALLFLIIFLVVVAVAVVQKMMDTPEKRLEAQKDKLSEFEAIYQTGDYAKLWEEVTDYPESYSPTYAKYYNVGKLYDDYIWADKWNYTQAYFYIALRDEYPLEELYADMSYSLKVLATGLKYRDAGYVYGEQYGVDKILGDMETSVKFYYCLSDEEFDTLLNMYLEMKKADEYEYDHEDEYPEGSQKESEKIKSQMIEYVKDVPARMLEHPVEERIIE